MIYIGEIYFENIKAFVDPQYTKYTTSGLGLVVLKPCHGPPPDPSGATEMPHRMRGSSGEQSLKIMIYTNTPCNYNSLLIESEMCEI